MTGSREATISAVNDRQGDEEAALTVLLRDTHKSADAFIATFGPAVSDSLMLLFDRWTGEGGPVGGLELPISEVVDSLEDIGRALQSASAEDRQRLIQKVLSIANEIRDESIDGLNDMRRFIRSFANVARELYMAGDAYFAPEEKAHQTAYFLRELLELSGRFSRDAPDDLVNMLDGIFVNTIRLSRSIDMPFRVLNSIF